MKDIKELTASVEYYAAKKCPDYDADCADVKNHLQCWKGWKSGQYFTAPADGFCPFVIGMEKQK